MRNHKVSQEDRFIQQKLQEAFGYTDEQLAAQLDQAAAEYATHPELQAARSEDDFQRLLEQAAQKKNSDDTEARMSGQSQKKVIRLKRYLKPAILVAAVGVIMLGTGMMASGRRQYKFWMRNKGVGEIVYNNVDALTDASSLEQAYEVISDQLGVSILQLVYVPAGTAYAGVMIEEGVACIDLRYKENYLYYQQVVKTTANSIEYRSDREPYKTVYNKYLKREIPIFKNELEDGQVELNAQFLEDEIVYSLIGTINETVFDKIVEQIGYNNKIGYKPGR